MPLDVANINLVDLAILTLLIISTGWGMLRGFIKESLALLGWLVALYLARQYAAMLSERLLEAVALQPQVAWGVAAIAIIIVVKLVVGLGIFAIRNLVKRVGVSMIDRMLGAIFGFARGGLIVTIVLMLGKEVKPIEQHQQWQASQLIPHCLIFEAWLGGVMGIHRPKLDT